MDKIIQKLRNSSRNGNEQADDVLVEIEGYDQNQLAEYVYTHDSQLRKLLGVKNLVEKGGNPEFTKEYFDLYKQGRSMYERDPYTKNDVNGQPLKEIPYYMEKFGVPKEHGEYTREQQAAFANSVSNLDRDELANLAWQEGFEGDADQMRSEIARAGQRLQQQFYRSGYDPDGSWSLSGKAKNLASSFFIPRISEAKQAGADATWRDKVGDAVEAGLNVVPGLGVLGKMAGKIGSKIPRIAASVGANAFESAAVPFLANATDVGLYSVTGDPRGEWDPERILAQTAGTIGIKGAVKAGAGNAKNLLELRAGKDLGGSAFKDAMDMVEDIGNSTKDNIARRQLVMERKAYMAKNGQYAEGDRLTSKQNKTGYFATADDLVDAEDFAIRKAEAERLRKIQPALERNDKIIAERQTREANGETKMPPELKLTEADQALLETYSENPEIYQLPDGRFVHGETINKGNGSLYSDIYRGNGIDATDVTWLQNTGAGYNSRSPIMFKSPDGNKAIIVPETKPRDVTVRKELAQDPDFNRYIKGDTWKEPLRDVSAQFIGNAGAREGWLGTGGNDLMGKRESALWNRQLLKLRPLVEKASDKRQMVDVIMNVMTFGRGIAPDEYAKNKTAYDAVFDRLGLEYQGVPTDPTTSQSMAR